MLCRVQLVSGNGSANTDPEWHEENTAFVTVPKQSPKLKKKFNDSMNVHGNKLSSAKVLLSYNYNFVLLKFVVITILHSNLRVGKIFLFRRSFSDYELIISIFASLQLAWAATKRGLLGPAT